MKKIIFLLVAVVAMTTIFDSCKKGPQDPGISFHSRKGRMEGKWTLASGTMNSSSTSGGTTSTSNMTITGTAYTQTWTVGGFSGSSDGTYTLTYEFTKDGKYTVNITNTPSTGGGVVIVESGTWDFLSGVGSLKNKEAIAMTKLSSTNTQGGITTTSTYSADNSASTYILTGLSSKSLIVDYSSIESAPNVSSSTTHLQFSK